MNNCPKEIFGEYTNAVNFKSAIGALGLYEQNKINERFYTGDQWHGVSCGDKKPLVRHNVIKRIGDYKISQILSKDIAVKISAEGIPEISGQEFTDKKGAEIAEINSALRLLSNYRSVTAKRLDFDILCSRALKNAYVTGSGVIYTYWDPYVNTGLYISENPSIAVKGDIKSEVLNIDDVYFADPYETETQAQQYIIIASRIDASAVIREAKAAGADNGVLSLIKGEEDGKVLLLTKLFKKQNENGKATVHCVKVTERITVRPEFDTGLSMYPIAVFRWDERSSCVYGDTELTYLIPNQIAINRMITASVWSSVTMGMPMLVVNGDTISDDISNDPGQIIKVYGSNEDVSGAVRYITPPDVCSDFGNGINTLIKNTLEQSGAGGAALGDIGSDNASVLQLVNDAAALQLSMKQRRFYGFIGQITRIWADFWVTQYGIRRIKTQTEEGSRYTAVDFAKYKNLYLTASVEASDKVKYSAGDLMEVLDKLLEKGIINKRQYVERLPRGIVPDTEGVLSGIEENKNEGV